ncbi:hypothetical protein SAPIO_CDS4505 [Scedosporium apiospermum]|uniref:NACHT domain-containing protein n=1 Tax=Pseudallescheria apiosperma TaxID=563466 RepID=A0A084G8B7_PSEDA|nr:uncharacterized protein SAPIO_CDS4505 [Scedosporium apiospermum]KEZ43579.1 hypothetical protein SAPIO_CDS4505 [Scedosporium apiospermum]
MADPLSVTGSAVGIVSLGLTVSKGLIKYIEGVRGRKSNTDNTARKLKCLLDSLNVINSQISDPNFRPKQDLLSNIERSIQDCKDSIGKLEAENKKFLDLPMDSIPTVARAGLRRVAYPFKEETLRKLEGDVEAAISCLKLALDALQKHDRNEMKLLLDLVRADQISSDIRDWLKGPDASIEYNAACKKKQEYPSTGLWFVKGKPFSSWLESSNSLLWLNGFAGSGKSVLCSTAIQSTFSHRGANKRIAIAFFFFVFNDKSKQDVSAMLRALILQLSTQLEDRGSLLELHNRYRNASPPDDALVEYLHQLISMFDHVYILLDALDESPRDKSGKRKDVLNILVEMQNWAEPGLHLMVTSRDEPDIREMLSAPKDKIISMWDKSVDHDIATFVSKRLRDSKEFRVWEDDYDKIETAFTCRAKGVFRWVECQFKALENCPQSDDELDELLDSLPDSLDETYERILLNINPRSVKYVQPMLTLLCYAKRPLTVPELRDAIAVDLSEPPQFKPGRRLKTVDAIRRICPEFIEVDEQPDGEPPTVRIAHFSVQEYLESGRLSSEIAKFSNTKAFESWVTIWNIDEEDGKKPIGEIPSPIYYTSLIGLDSVLTKLLHSRVGNISDVNAQGGGRFGNALQAASLGGYEAVARLLLEKGADVNAQGGYYGNALQGASSRGHEAIVRLLLEKGAETKGRKL